MKRIAVVSLLISPAFALLPASAGGQVTRPVAKAIQENAREIGRLITLAAGVMPADLYTVRTPHPPRSFGETLSALIGQTEFFCARIQSATPPAGPRVSGTAGKAALVARVGAAFQLCERLLAGLDDSNLGAPYAGASGVTRAAAMLQASLQWSVAYGQLAASLRLNGLVPPIPCIGDIGMTSGCSTGVRICRPSSLPPEQGYLPPGSTATLRDAPYSVMSDGLGPYIAGPLTRSGHVHINASQVASLEFANPPGDGSVIRSIKVDLNHPVPADIGVPLGVVASNHNLELASQWYTDSSNIAHSIRDIPIGTTVTSEQTDVGIHLNGVYHILQMGPQRYGHCFSDGSATYGDGTTRATIHRVTATEWIVDLPPGSVGRLFDISLSAPNAINKGLYYVSLRYVIKQ